MKVVLVHNKYKEAGGEDAVFYAERELLRRYKHDVDELVLDNHHIKTARDKIFAGARLLYNPASAKTLKKKIQDFNPDIIHVHNFFPLVSPSVFSVAAKFNIPVILTLHNYRLLCPSVNLFYKNKIYEKSIHSLLPLHAILKGVYRDSRLQTASVALMTWLHAMLGTWKNNVDAYIALTDFAKAKFERSAISIPPNKLLVKSNFVKDRGTGERIRDDFFLFVGRLAEYKGIHTLLAAAVLGKFNLVIIGDGPLVNLVKSYADENFNISYLGFQTNDIALRYMSRCKAMIFPSLVYEGCPMTILEALSVGTVVIASNLGGIPEIVQHKVNGLHFAVGNAEDLVAQVAEIDNSPELLQEMSVNARLAYLDHYTPEKNYSRLMEIYNYALAVKSRSEAGLRSMTAQPTQA